MVNEKNILLGAHVSIAGSIENAIQRAEEINASAFQIFVKNNRQWGAPKISPDSAKIFITKLKNSKIKTAVAHATYLINTASENPETVLKSLESLKSELEACELLKIPYLVMHPGSSGKEDKNSGVKKIAGGINKVFSETESSTALLLETMAGQGSSIGSNFKELYQILNYIKTPERIGFCFDTCHAFAAGYKFSTQEDYDQLFDAFDKTLGLKNLKMFHVNDSKKESGCKVDRHENIGEGKIGLSAFEILMNDEKFMFTPKIIETPKDLPSEDIKNIKALVNLIKKPNLKFLDNTLLENYLI